eukprot:CAMPEP_0179923118 /NCGR_PEP_ID=MMETSP0983-20121128/6014_1 /TAXON_ID=483367 /ORGANISM="non described non described, Strain CCMP 2436" /LENGTH=40 /DNA_ID= /DNA_START= /DNA_END= /DNA_ORIENTATION=
MNCSCNAAEVYRGGEGSASVAASTASWSTARVGAPHSVSM